MHLIQEIRTSSLLIEIYSLNPNLVVVNDPSLFEGKNDDQIKEIVFNNMGAEEVKISDLDGPNGSSNHRGYAIV